MACRSRSTNAHSLGICVLIASHGSASADTRRNWQSQSSRRALTKSQMAAGPLCASAGAAQLWLAAFACNCITLIPLYIALFEMMMNCAVINGAKMLLSLSRLVGRPAMQIKKINPVSAQFSPGICNLTDVRINHRTANNLPGECVGVGCFAMSAPVECGASTHIHTLRSTYITRWQFIAFAL